MTFYGVKQTYIGEEYSVEFMTREAEVEPENSLREFAMETATGLEFCEEWQDWFKDKDDANDLYQDCIANA